MLEYIIDEIMKIAMPYLLFLFGIFVLLFIGNGYIAGPFFILSIVMILEQIWPSVKNE